ncbi:glycosyltransferase family 61 protein [Nocardioides lianchengensis]|uniref:Capsular polysaccharide biosynthesis protein n=1 Tax=Nocardioides lianchengensis TaxID=1045774 RepID=A0A1G6PHQ1_9ACTN|nr:glycosyltransferase 61 family protein [Nocardioides lianchengensis]NYG11855.1 capsular polysaccharide biosynthesis protein [Nocardioides lianchengensis]SDC79588.1 Capsular polysaccharide biosynthesis protein [Nocardioides lianchengensis]
MRARAARALATVPGARPVVRRLRGGRAAVRGFARRRRYAELAGLVASAAGGDAVVVVLGPASPRLVAAIRTASPRAQVREVVSADEERHLELALLGRVDVIVDQEDVAGRRHRFEETFFHLRAGGSYVVPDGAGELAGGPRTLGELLDPDATRPRGPRRARIRVRDLREVVAQHVTHRVAGPDLVLSHDADGVLAKMRESEFNAYLAAGTSRHRLLKTIPAGSPPPAPPGTEGPVPRRPPMHRRIQPAELSLRDYRDVVVGQWQRVVSDDLLLPDTFRHNQWPELVHTKLVEYGPRFAVPRPRMPADAPRLEGTFLHLDNEFRGHFGHLLTESLSRVWTWREALAIDPDVRVLVGATKPRPRPFEYELELYEAAGIPRDRIVVIDHPVRVDRLISGTPMFSHPQYVHPLIAETWREVGDNLAAKAEDRDWPRRFFVGRRSDKRACLNGADVEAIFGEYGFEVVYPEDFTLGEQIRLFRAAEVAGGYAGSGLFQIAFVPDPTHVIMVGAATYTPRNEYLMAAVHGHRVEAVICRPGGRSIQSSYTFDVEREGPFLRKLLDRLP